MRKQLLKYLNCLTFLLSLVVINSCKFPFEEVNKFNLNLDGALLNPLIKLNINLSDSAAPEKISFFITGKDAKWFYDVEGKTNFNAEGGSLYLVLHPDAQPSLENPYSITIHIIKEGYLSLRQDIIVTSNSEKYTYHFQLRKLSTTADEAFSKVTQLNFLGKKRTDTVFFQFALPSGITFNYKMPTNGLVFLRNSNFKFLPTTSNNSLSNIMENQSSFLHDLPNPEFPRVLTILSNLIVGKTLDPIETTSELSIVSKIYTTKTLVGYSLGTFNAIEEDRLTFDTISVTNVRVQMISRKKLNKSNYVDENGIYESTITSFEEDLIDFPELSFFDARTGTPLTPYYPNGYNGILTEVLLPTNSYKMFIEGIGYSTKINNPFYIKRAIQLQASNFIANGFGSYLFKFNNNLLGSSIFLYKTSKIGCKEKYLKMDYPSIPLNAGFSATVNIDNENYSLSYELLFNKPITEIPVVSFPNQISIVTANINHSFQSCQSTTSLFNETIANLDLCNVSTPIIALRLNYDGFTYLNSIPKLESISASAKIDCPSGNTITPPTIDVKFWKLGCDAKTQLRIENGQFYTNSLIENNQSYVIQFDRISSAGKPISSFDTLFFDPNIVTQAIKDDTRGFWFGTLNYSDINGYSLDITLDNKKLKYSLPNCK